MTTGIGGVHTMGLRAIVRNQKVEQSKIALAKTFRSVMTPEERLLWQHLRAHRLGGLHFRRQQVIDGFIVDFYSSSAGVVIEVDGPIHEWQTEYDIERDRILAARGLRVMRIRNEEIRGNLADVLNHIRRELTASVPLPLEGEGKGEGSVLPARGIQ